MTYISKSEFADLSDVDKHKYYEGLKSERNSVFTAKDMDDLAQAYEAIETYKNAVAHAKELRYSAQEQRKEDLRYNLERRKKGILVTVMVVACFVLVAAVYSMISLM